MRKLFLLFIILFSFNSIYSQSYNEIGPYLDFGIRGMGGLAFLSPKSFAVNDSAGAYTHMIESHGYGGSFSCGLNFTEYISIGSEFVFIHQNQKFMTKYGDKTIIINRYEIPIMLRYMNNNYSYVQAGMVFSNPLSVNDCGIEATDLYTKYCKGIILEAGSTLTTIGYAVNILMGLRARYDLDDNVNPNNNKSLYSNIFALNKNAEPANNLSVMLVLQFNLAIGLTYAKSNCGGRRRLILNTR